MENGLDCTRQHLQFLWCLAISDTKLFPTTGCHKLCKPCCPRVPEGELQHRHNKYFAALRGKSEVYMGTNLLLAFTSNNWALQIDLILWFHWDYWSSTGMIYKGAIFLGQTLRSINLITALLNKAFLEPFVDSSYRTHSIFWWFSCF